MPDEAKPGAGIELVPSKLVLPNEDRPDDLHAPTPGHLVTPLTEMQRKSGVFRVVPPMPTWDRGAGTYVAQHSTNYNWNAAVRRLVLKYLNHPALKGKISINTYLWHPPYQTGVIEQRFDFVSYDVWAWGGRGHPLSPELRKSAFKIIFNDPEPPPIYWIISGGRMWIRGTGWQDAPWGPVDSDPDHIFHIHQSSLIA